MTDLRALADALRSADFTVDGAHALMGDAASRALARNETTPGVRATTDGSPLATLVRLFQLQRPVAASAAEVALPRLVEPLVAEGLLATSGDEVRALVDLRPYGDEDHDWWVVCDRTPGLDHGPSEPGRDFVLGISEASSSLARLVGRRPVGRALDLGTGCGVQALHLSTHARQVVATDVNPRALWMTRLTAQLNGVDVDVRDGSLYEPVAGERFDLIATNPPFVVSPDDAEKLTYRDSGLPGDEVVRRVVAGAADHLEPDGWCQVLASWVIADGRPWDERLADWIRPTGLDAWVVQREAADLPTYVEMWLADAGLRAAPDYTDHYDRWLRWFEAQGIEAMGFGWINLRRADRDQPVVRLEPWTHDVAGAVGPHVLAWGERVDALAAAPDVLDVRWRAADHLVQETYGRPGAEDPEAIVLRLGSGLLRARQVDTLEAGLVGALDGDLTARQVLAALAELLDVDADALFASHGPVVHDLVSEGYLQP